MASLLIIPSGTAQASLTANGWQQTPTLSRIAVSPPIALLSSGSSQVFRAIGQYDNGSMSDITLQAAWSSSTSSLSMSASTGSWNRASTPSPFLTAIVFASSGTVTGSAVVDLRGIPTPTPIIVETGSVKFHVWSSGSNLLDTVSGNIWSMSGTVPYVSASGAMPPGWGPFTDTNFYQSGSGNDSADLTGSFTCVVIARGPTGSFASNPQIVISNGEQTVAGGWFFGHRAGAAGFYTNIGTDPANVNSVTPVPSGSVYFAVFGRSGTTGYIQINSSSFVTGTVANTAATAIPIRLGKYNANTLPYTGGGAAVYEVYFSDSTPTSASFSNLWTQVKDRLGSPLP